MVMNAPLKKEDCPPQVTPALRTGFMEEFKKRFLPDTGRAWLTQGLTNDVLARDLETFAYALLDRGTRLAPEKTVAVLGLNQELFAQLMDFMNSYQNPTLDPARFWPMTGLSPQEGHIAKTTVRFWEVSVCLDRCLHAAADAKSPGGGGGMSKWPPV